MWDGDEEARTIGEEIEALQRDKHALSQIAILRLEIPNGAKKVWNSRDADRRYVEPKPFAEAKVVSIAQLGGLQHRYTWRRPA